MRMNQPAVLKIAGSDSSGGEGIQVDLKAFGAFGVYGASVLTALTAQNTCGVTAIADIDPAFIAAQIDAVAEDLPIAAAKTGMLSHSAVIEVVADRLRAHPVPFLVVDPVMVAASGDALLKPEAIASLRDLMIPLATIGTPNIYEAEILTGIKVTGVDAMRDAARALGANGPPAPLVKGGRFDAGDAIDVYCDGRTLREV